MTLLSVVRSFSVIVNSDIFCCGFLMSFSPIVSAFTLVNIVSVFEKISVETSLVGVREPLGIGALHRIALLYSSYPLWTCMVHVYCIKILLGSELRLPVEVASVCALGDYWKTRHRKSCICYRNAS